MCFTDMVEDAGGVVRTSGDQDVNVKFRRLQVREREPAQPWHGRRRCSAVAASSPHGCAGAWQRAAAEQPPLAAVRTHARIRAAEQPQRRSPVTPAAPLLQPEEDSSLATCNIVVMEYCDRGSLRQALKRGVFHKRIGSSSVAVDLCAIVSVRGRAILPPPPPPLGAWVLGQLGARPGWGCTAGGRGPDTGRCGLLLSSC
jgi:hypothetical protein